MSTLGRLSLAMIVAFSATLALPSARAAVPARTINVQVEIEMIKKAYGTLAKADHDYKGHRIRAMHHLDAALDALGSDRDGDGKGHETQPISDDHLREAKKIVERVQAAAAEVHQDTVADHLAKAVQELDTALKIK